MRTEACIRVSESDPAPGWNRLILSDRITVESAQCFLETAKVLVDKAKHVTISCEQAEYMDLSAIQILLAFGRELAQRGKQCEIEGVTGPLAETLNLAGLGNGNSES
jgi:anti-anti-sigma regulatory factor